MVLAVSSILLYFYAPLVIGVILMVSAFLVKADLSDFKSGEKFPIQLFGVIRVEVPAKLFLKRPWIAKGLVFIGGFLLIYGAITSDMTKYFPSELSFEVFFDDDGLIDFVDSLSDEEKADLQISDNWAAFTSLYDNDVKQQLARLWAHSTGHAPDDTSLVDRRFTTAQGRTTFNVVREGMFEYRLSESSGVLDHSVSVPRAPPIGYRTTFELRPSRHNTMRPSVLDVLFRGVLMRPEYNQVLNQTDNVRETVPIDHVIIGVTRLHVFPSPRFGDTLYLLRRVNMTSIPVAYAQYYGE